MDSIGSREASQAPGEEAYGATPPGESSLEGALRVCYGHTEVHPSAKCAPSPLSKDFCLGDFRVLREIGRGGMGIVYEAEQVSLGRKVALKVLPAVSSGSASFIERFRREAQAIARLHHTNIVTVFGLG